MLGIIFEKHDKAFIKQKHGKQNFFVDFSFQKPFWIFLITYLHPIDNIPQR